MVGVVVFDFDGTLVDSVGSIWAEYVRVMDLMGLRKVSYSEFSGHVGKTWDQVLLGLWPDVDVDEFTRLYRVDAEVVKPVPGVLSVLRELGGSYTLAVLSSRGNKSLMKYLRVLGFEERLFSRIYHRDNVVCHKPDPGVFEQISLDLGVESSELVFVGDSLVDAECSKGAGVRFIGVLTGAASEGDFRGAGFGEVVESVADLPGKI
jgi:phosphoglycolate phosphatase